MSFEVSIECIDSIEKMSLEENIRLYDNVSKSALHFSLMKGFYEKEIERKLKKRSENNEDNK